jgi:S1-C subfamily serine protease
MFRLVFASLLASTPTPTSPNETLLVNVWNHPPKANLHISAIRLIRCGEGLGTAVYIDKRGILITAAHVLDTEEGTCTDVQTRQTYKVYYKDIEKDYAFLHGDTKRDDRFLEPSCEPMKAGRKYLSVGFGGGYDLRIDQIKFTGKHTSDFEFAEGPIHYKFPFAKSEGVLVPGMSGGAVIDIETKTLVGINNISTAWSQSFSREIKDTVLCQR